MSIKVFLKRTVFFVSLILVSPMIFLAWAESKVANGEGLFVGLGQLLSLFPGKLGSYLRSAYYFGTLEDCSWQVHIGFGSFFSHRKARLGTHVAMGSYCVIGTASIGDGVMMASRVSVPSGKRQHFDDNGTMSPTPRFDRVTIGSNTWIGEGVVILANVGQNCIVSAGAVVVNPTPERQLMAGNPAKSIRLLPSAVTKHPAVDTVGNR